MAKTEIEASWKCVNFDNPNPEKLRHNHFLKM